MDIKYDCTNHTTYLRIAYADVWTVASGQYLIDKIKEEASQSGIYHILLDVREYSIPDDEFTRYKTGIYMADQLDDRFRIATIYPADITNHFMENVVTNRGVRLKAHTNETDALAWLLADQDALSAYAI